MLRRRAFLRHGAAALFIGGAVALWFWPILLTNRVLVGADSLAFFMPYWAYAADSLKHGYVPLWNPYLFAGVPFLANPPSAMVYPLFWPFRWLLEPAKAILVAYVFHVWLGGFLTYLYARRSLGLPLAGALLAGLVWAGSGYVGGQAEHVSHLSAAAWLPGMMLLLDGATRWRPCGDATGPAIRLGALAGLSIVVAFTLLTGHTQFAYIGLFATGLYALWPLAVRVWQEKRGLGWHTVHSVEARRPLVFLLAVALGFLLAAVQLLPTWELAQMSARGGGLTYREVMAFSLGLRTMLYTLLPAFGQSLEAAFATPAFPEFVAYVGIGPLLLAVWAALAGQRPLVGFPVALAVAGLALAVGGYNPLNYVLYQVVPGFDLFRTPARWLSLYVLGLALLAGVGIEALRARRSWSAAPWRPWWLAAAVPLVVALVWLRKPGWEAWAGWLALALATLAVSRYARATVRLVVLALLVVAELYLGARTLPHAHPTAPEAATSLRTAPAAILADGAQGRVLSMSDLTFDPGDMAQHRQLYAGQLNPREFYDFNVATKMKETLAPNLPLVYRIPSLDGYDGGLLPLPAYVAMQRLLLPEDEIAPDGRLWQRLHTIPPQSLLDLFHVQYFITDKLADLWLDGVYYDLAQSAMLSAHGSREASGAPVALLEATAIGIVFQAGDDGNRPDGVPVGELILADDAGRTERVVVSWGGEAVAIGDAYWTVVPIPDGPLSPVQVTARLLNDELDWIVRAVSLIDERTGAHRPVLLSTEQRLRRIHSGDVKVYRVADGLPRAYVVHQARVIADDEEAIEAMQQADFDPRRAVILADGEPLSAPAASGQATIRVDTPERLVVDVTLAAPGYLALSDTYYPGWRAMVDGEPVPIVRANVLFRAVPLAAGQHTVEFIYAPASLRVGLVMSAIACLLVCTLLVAGRRQYK